MTLKIGLTGGIGAGKSTVAKIFQSLGAPVFFADMVAKEIIREDAWIRQQIISVFGSEAYQGKEYNSAFIAGQVFANKELLKQLNKIVHPKVHESFNNWYQQNLNAIYVIEEAALLIESGGKAFFDHIVVVTAPLDIRIERLMSRDLISEEQIRKRINSQLKEEEMILHADSVITNGESDLLIPRVIELHNKFVNLYNKTKK